MENPNLLKNTLEAALRLRAVIETAIDGIITIDEKGIVETVNPAAAKMFGYEAKEIIGNNISMLMPSPYREKHDGYIQRYLKTEEAHIIGIGRKEEGLKKDGSVFPIRLAVSEVILDDKLIFTGIIHDLTEVEQANKKILQLNRQLENKVGERTEKLAKVVGRLLQTNTKLKNEIQERQKVEKALRQREEELKAALEKEKELNELKSRFVSIASHEFRTPLGTILSSIELVEAYTNENQQSKRKKHINRIKNTVEHLTGVLHDFLSMSRLEEGQIQPEPQWFFFRDFCRQVLDEIRVQLKPGQTIKHSGRNEDQEIYLDKTALRVILFNLLSNATKYSNEGKTIECTTEIEHEELCLTIKDEGIGIPEFDQKHLFTRFFRAHNVENIKGTGLGLNIARRYVNLLGGKIEFESELGIGTTFRVFIPLRISRNVKK